MASNLENSQRKLRALSCPRPKHSGLIVVTARSQLESGFPKNQSNPIPQNIQPQNIRHQNASNINSRPIERNVQQAPNYQTQPAPPSQQAFQQQQQQAAYRLPSAGQTNFQQNPQQGQPVIRPPVNAGVRQPINPNQQQPPIRNIPPNINQQIRQPINQNQQPQFRQPQPQQQQQLHQQQFQRPPNFPPNQGLGDNQQFRPQQQPTNLQKQAIPDQKFIRNPPPTQNPSMMSEKIRERTFTTSNEHSMDDDDDVVVGRGVTPQTKPLVNSKPSENYDVQQQQAQRQMSVAKENISPAEKNGHSPISPLKSPSKIPSYQPRPASITPKTRSRSTSKQRLSLRISPETEQPEPLIKSGGNVKIESKKLEIKAAPRIEAKNDAYVPRGGDKKILSQKLQWNAKSKIGSLENASHKPGGGDKRILEVKTDFKEKAKPKVGSKDNMTYQPGGGDVKIISQKLEVKGESKIGSLDNVKHRPGGGDKKIFDDKEYLKNVDHPVPISPPTQTSLQSGDPSTDNLADKDLVHF
ncbi:CLUMA_CG000874, isoform B [Clunio marinus]|uniref:Microtubule-associated protein n=1 Tax=Clunio marinus TaxID=568069 RepID=A0A1J1HKN1_9DIPT|nr:CLUMA_CG000874, isoform B [Clunio marinus]